MLRPRLPNRFSLPPSWSSVRQAHRRPSTGRNCNAASDPTIPPLPTEPSGKPTAMMTLDQLICGEAREVLDTPSSRLPNTTPPTLSLVRGQSSATDQPLTPHAQQYMDDLPVGCGLYELQRPVFAAAGIFVGTLPPNRLQVCREALILLGFEALSEEAADAKGDFHEADLYRNVTAYVREGFNNADKLNNEKRKGTVGFALTRASPSRGKPCRTGLGSTWV